MNAFTFYKCTQHFGNFIHTYIQIYAAPKMVTFSECCLIKLLSHIYLKNVLIFCHWKLPAQGTSTVPTVSAHWCCCCCVYRTRVRWFTTSHCVIRLRTTTPWRRPPPHLIITVTDTKCERAFITDHSLSSRLHADWYLPLFTNTHMNITTYLHRESKKQYIKLLPISKLHQILTVFKILPLLDSVGNL